MTAVALLETIGVGTIVPFMMVVANPSVLHEDNWVGRIYAWSAIGSDDRFLFLLGLAVLFVLVGGNALKATGTWSIHRFSQMAGYAIALQLFRTYLARPYEYFLTRHSADLGKNILTEVQQVVSGVLWPGLSALSRAIAVLLLIALLLVADPLLTLAAVLTLSGAYALIYVGTRRYLLRIGQKQVAANRARYYVASEVFSGVKEVKLKGLEDVSAERLSGPSLQFARHLAVSHTLSQAPRYVLEVIAFGGILLIILFLLAERKGLSEALPLVSLYAFAGYRMLPALQEVFNGVTRMRFSWATLELVRQEMMSPVAPALPFVAPLPFERAIRLENVSYRYPLGDAPALVNIYLEIPRGARVGFIGPTGSGKSTAIDVILGLLRPSNGRVMIDGIALDSEELIRSWQARIGYVPQHIFLADDTVAANIAFGEVAGRMNHAAVERAARMAQLHDFVTNELPRGYDTPVGERGIRLSGGQRQRLGLARALYGNPAVLVLDEATSALDNETEAAVIQALDELRAGCTVIMIAHRLTTVRCCDFLVRMEDGRVTASGTPDKVLEGKEPTYARI
jgi:ABC-type multidrug transport system fused ATPase/permease subunit